MHLVCQFAPHLDHTAVYPETLRIVAGGIGDAIHYKDNVHGPVPDIRHDIESLIVS